MRFLFLTQYYPPEVGAVQTRLSAVAAQLQRMNHDVEVVTGLPNYPIGRVFANYRKRAYLCEDVGGIPVHRVWLYPSMGTGIRRMANYASFALTSLLGLMRANRPNYIFVESPPLFLGLTGCLASALWGVPLVFNVADLWPDSLRELGIVNNTRVLRIAERLESRIYQKASYVNAVTEGIRNTLIQRKNVPPGKVLFFPNGVDVDLFKPTVPDNELVQELALNGKKVIVYAGTLGLAHGVRVALDAMEILQSRGIDLWLVLIGSGSEKASLVQIAQAKRLSKVIFLDPKSVEYVSRLYSLACGGLVTLRNLDFFDGTRPAKMFPIMACGKPVLYSGSGEGARLVERSQAGIVVPPEDAKGLADAMVALVENPLKAGELGRNGRRYVEDHLSWSAVVHNWIDELQQRVPVA